MSFVVPAEWSPHRAMWLGFPSHAELWEDDLEPAQAEVAALARALAGPGGERVRLMSGCAEGEAAARALLGGVDNIEIAPGAFGDIWLRDTGPIFTAIHTAQWLQASTAGAASTCWNGDDTVGRPDRRQRLAFRTGSSTILCLRAARSGP